MTIDVIEAARGRARRRLVLAALILLVISAAVTTLSAYLLHRLGHTEPGPSPTTWSRPSAAAPGAVVLPVDATWTRAFGVELPSSPATGPVHLDPSGLASGFTHTTAGALVAALHLLVRTTPQVGPGVFEPTIAAQVVGEDADALLRTLTDQYTRRAAALGIAYGEPLGDLPAALHGVRIESADTDRVSLTMLTAAYDQAMVRRYAATTVTVMWQRGDWRLLAPPGGSWDAVVHLVDQTQADGYPPLVRG